MAAAAGGRPPPGAGAAYCPKRLSGSAAKASSSGVEGRPSAALRWGNRPNRRMMSRCLRPYSRLPAPVVEAAGERLFDRGLEPAAELVELRPALEPGFAGPAEIAGLGRAEPEVEHRLRFRQDISPFFRSRRSRRPGSRHSIATATVSIAARMSVGRRTASFSVVTQRAPRVAACSSSDMTSSGR